MNRHPIARLLTHAARWTALSGSSVKAVLDAAHCFSLETPNGLGPIEGGSDSGTFPALGSEHKFDIAPLSSLRLSRLKELTLNSNFLSQPLGKLVVKDERLRSLQSLIVFTPSRTPAHRSRTLHRFISPMKKLERLELQLTYATSSMEDSIDFELGLERFSLTLQTAFSGKTPKVERGDLEQVSIDPLLQYLTVTPSPPTVSGPGQGVELAVHFPSLRRVAIRGFSFTCSAFLDMLAFRRPTSTLPAGTAANTLLIAFIGDVKVTWALVSAWTPPSVMQIIKLESRRYVVVSPSRFTMGNPPLNRQSQSLGTSVTARLLRAASAGRLNTSIEVTSRMIVFPALKAFRTRADNTWAEIQIEAGSLNNQLGMGSYEVSLNC
ncbi:hypothetical protein BDV98DRAFT_597597 [Pterulicium gracile]|uniref:Uncharacterized protein n=1 Tax=Pterulicium gracile TaxID=1884261 RepID=A0A5C3Q8A4_9AGAR|nr:hypothetical protein BDV98DRAFT_597597 [Pterula gracilis]